MFWALVSPIFKSTRLCLQLGQHRLFIIPQVVNTI